MTTVGLVVENLEQEMERRMHLGIRPGLQRMQQVLHALGDPQLRLGKVALVAGTNGKGSTCAFLESILRAAGSRVGLYVSPHLARFTERIRVAGSEVNLTQLQPALTRVMGWEAATGEMLTGFELVTAVAFDFFGGQSLDACVVEVGMGGRFDATNVVEPIVSVITSVGLDHMEFLGATRREIAWEKAGIMRPGVPCILGRQSPDVLPVLKAEAEAKRVPLVAWGQDFHAAGSASRMSFRSRWRRVEGVTLGLSAAYQLENAAVAVQAASQFLGNRDDGEDAIRAGLAGACWPGRFDLRCWKGIPILLDGAHNVPGMEALVDALTLRWPGRRYRLLFSSKAGKQTRQVLQVLAPLVESAVVTSLPRFEGTPLQEMAGEFPIGMPVEVVQNVDEAWLRCLLGPGEFRLCCGSLYLVGYCLSHFELPVCGPLEEP